MEAPNDAAVPERPQPLDRSIDSFACQRAERHPPELRQHLIDVIQSASVSPKTRNRAGNVSPEAIELAVEIQREAALATTLRGVTSFENIDPALARQLLGQMEARAA